MDQANSVLWCRLKLQMPGPPRLGAPEEHEASDNRTGAKPGRSTACTTRRRVLDACKPRNACKPRLFVIALTVSTTRATGSASLKSHETHSDCTARLWPPRISSRNFQIDLSCQDPCCCVIVIQMHKGQFQTATFVPQLWQQHGMLCVPNGSITLLCLLQSCYEHCQVISCRVFRIHASNKQSRQNMMMRLLLSTLSSACIIQLSSCAPTPSQEAANWLNAYAAAR